MTNYTFYNSISTQKAQRLFWLGRYAERAYITLHLLRKHFDLMIDQDDEAFFSFCKKMNITNVYLSANDFITSYIYDIQNPDSIVNMLERANDNAILLREDISTEVLSFIQLPLCHIKSNDPEHNSLDNLQEITDHLLAFWGSLDERIHDPHIRNAIKFGRFLESADLHIRFGYDEKRIMPILNNLDEVIEKEGYLCDEMAYLKLKSNMNKGNVKTDEVLGLLSVLFRL